MRKLFFSVLMAAAATTVVGQIPSTSSSMPHDYRGVQVHIDGIWVTPVPNAPFTATVEVVSHEFLPDGSEHVVKSTNHIARSSSGRIRNERRQLVPREFQGEPRLLSAHLYDPGTRLNIFYDPLTHIARQTTLPAPLRTPIQAQPPTQQGTAPDVVETDLGIHQMNGVELHGFSKSRTIPADRSGIGKPVVVTDEYWYSAVLSIYTLIRHTDPRTGEQLVAVTSVERGEPPAELMNVPSEYKIVDETPPTLSRVPAQ